MLGELSKDKRRLAIKSSGETVFVWTISGIVLAACGGGGGGGGGFSFGPRAPTAPPVNVSDGPVSGARVYFDTDGDGEVSAAEMEEQGDGYPTGTDGQTDRLPLAYRGVAFVVIVDGAIDTDTGKTLSGSYQSIASPEDGQHRIATPITDLIARAQREDETTEAVVARILTAARMNPATANQQLEHILDPAYYDTGTNKHGDDLFIISLTNEVAKDKASGRPETDPIDLVINAVSGGYLTPATISYANTDGMFAENFDTSNHLATLTHPITITTAVIVGVVYTDKTTGREVTLTGTSDRAAIDRLFSIDLNGGSPQIFVGTGGLDFERAYEYILTVDLGDARDETIPALVKIIVTDVNENDNPPTLSASGVVAVGDVYPVEMMEASAGAQSGISFTIADNDTDATNGFANDSFTISAKDAGNADAAAIAALFEVGYDTTTKIGTLQLEPGMELDREARGLTADGKISLLVKVNDSNVDSNEIEVEITINDLNEHAPKLTASANSADMGEVHGATDNVDTTITFTLTDADSAKQYDGDDFIVSDSRFAVANVGGVWRLLLSQNATLDYETEQSLALTIKVADTGMPAKESNSETITINVGNANDNPPVFGAEQVTWQSGFANGAVAETTDGSVTPVHIATVNARDPDRAVVSSFGVLTYSLANDYGKFDIDDAGVITLTAKLDREGANPDPAEYSLLATISDGATSITTDPIIVKVLHVDESDPEFDDALRPLDWEFAFAGGRITEGTYTNERIGTLAASDADSDAELTYSIVSGGGGLFSIKSGTNQLILNGVLDYDTATGGATSHTLIFGVSDGSGAIVQSDPYTINVVDENDNDPQFGAVRWVAGTVDLNDANIVTIDEGSTGNLLTIPATDADTGAALQLSILSGNANDADGNAIFTFAASGDGGLLTISGDLDYESATKSYTLELQVEDDGGRTDPHSVTINVKDINDNAPTMTLSGNSSINERLATDTSPIVAGITITIADADATDAHKSSVSGGPRLDFTVYEADGTTVNSDYAVVRKAGGAVNEYQLQHTGDTLDASTTSSVALKIGVTDNVNPSPPQLPVTLTVNNLDEGDDAPSDSLADAEIYENHPLSKAIGSITVPDGANFMLSDGFDNDLFTIRDGKLWWISTPDYESPADADTNNIYEIEVTFTKTDDTTTRQRYDLEVMDIGPGRYDYGSSNRDGGAWVYTHHYPDVPLPEEPGGLSNYILGGHAFVTPETGPPTLTWALDPDSDYTAAQTRPIVERAFALYEAAANFKFIEVDWSASKDIEMFFRQSAIGGEADSRHKFRAQIDRIRVGSPKIESLETDSFPPLLHEIGHILGLKHPFDEDLEARPVGEWLWDAGHLRNPNTIMSYYNFNNDPDRGDELLPADIAALRFLYGPPEGTAGAEDWEPPHWLVRSNNFRVNPSPSSEPIFISETAAAGAELYTITVENNFILRFPNPPTPARSAYELPNGRDNEFFQFDSVTGVLSLKQKLDYGNPLDKGDFYAGNNVYEVVINGRHSFDDAATQAIWGNSIYVQYLPIVVLESIDLATEGLTDINLVTRGAAKTPTDYGGKEVIGTDGVNRISDGHGHDIIRGNGNDDIITLTTTPKDENKVIYRIGNQVAIDGGDQVTGFERGKDELILALPENMTTSAITNFAGFVSHINGGTPTDLTDDWFGVKLVTDAGKTMLEGLSFHFEKIVVGAGSSSVMDITFSASAPLSEALGSTTLASITNSDGFLTDFGLLDDLLGGEQSFKFITEEFTIPTNTMVVGAALNDSDPSITAADDLLGGADFLGFEII